VAALPVAAGVTAVAVLSANSLGFSQLASKTH
jgi:hypothetical protein